MGPADSSTARSKTRWLLIALGLTAAFLLLPDFSSHPAAHSVASSSSAGFSVPQPALDDGTSIGPLADALPDPLAASSSLPAPILNPALQPPAAATLVPPSLEDLKSTPPFSTPASTTPSKAIIGIADPDDDPAWISTLLPSWTPYLYSHAPDAALRLPSPRGREAAAYLSFLVAYYDALPEIMVFIHGARYQWHADDPMYDMLPSIQRLDLRAVQHRGYVSLRCTWWPGCPVFVRPRPGKADDAGAMHSIDGLYAAAWAEFFPGVAVPGEVGAPCCAQFAVSRAQVLKRGKAEYERYLAWVLAERETSMRVGEVFEYLWHVIFGRSAMMCDQPAGECFCEVFGHCGLECPNERECKGRYWRLPWKVGALEGWPEEGQGVDGMPFEGWWENATLRDEKVYGES